MIIYKKGAEVDIFSIADKISDTYKKGKYWVYFISNNNGSIKIGITNNIKRRFTYLQNGSPTQLKVMAIEPCADKLDAEMLEREMHSFFSEHRQCGEWFKEQPIIDFLNWMAEYCAIPNIQRTEFEKEHGIFYSAFIEEDS